VDAGNDAYNVSKFPRFTAWCSGAFLQLLRNQNFNRLSMRGTPVTSANDVSVLRICDLPTCPRKLARPVQYKRFVSTDLKRRAALRLVCILLLICSSIQRCGRLSLTPTCARERPASTNRGVRGWKVRNSYRGSEESDLLFTPVSQTRIPADLAAHSRSICCRRTLTLPSRREGISSSTHRCGMSRPHHEMCVDFLKRCSNQHLLSV